MKLLATDYDGTLMPDIKNLNFNIPYIKKFMNKGNKFMIITGRSYKSIKKQTEIFNIPYDYLSCNDGATLFDNKGNLLYADYLKVKDIELLISRLAQLSVTRKIDIYGIHDRIDSLDNIIELAIKVNLFDDYKQLFNLLNEYNLDSIKVQNNIFIENKGGKSRSINHLQNNFDKIITVGDSENDLSMLREYKGYRMLLSSPILYLYKLKTTTSVKKLIKEYL